MEQSQLQNMPLRNALHLDAVSSRPELLARVDFLERMVREVAKLASMRVISQLTSDIEVDLEKLKLERFEDEGGISVQALISTSHISLHGWPSRGVFMFDLVSCRNFDEEAVRQHLYKELHVEIVLYENFVEVADHLAFERGFNKQMSGN